MASLNRHQFRTYYHGTSDRNVESIKKHGLKAHNPAEGYEGLKEGETHEPGHPTGVYLSQSLEVARDYGDSVFSVELPDSAPWAWTGSEGEVLKHDIHPYMLKHIEE